MCISCNDTTSVVLTCSDMQDIRTRTFVCAVYFYVQRSERSLPSSRELWCAWRCEGIQSLAGTSSEGTAYGVWGKRCATPDPTRPRGRPPGEAPVVGALQTFCFSPLSPKRKRGWLVTALLLVGPWSAWSSQVLSLWLCVLMCPPGVPGGLGNNTRVFNPQVFTLRLIARTPVAAA